MDSISKRWNLSQVVKDKESEDRISNLPWSLIGHILSFLPTKDVVATSILSTKWKYLWISISNFDFDDQLVSNKSRDSYSTHLPVENSFIDFVNRVLLLATSDIHKFCLKCSQQCGVSTLNSWVSTALSRNVQELKLFLPKAGFRMLSRELFYCSTLVELKLGSRFVLHVPTSICLPSLKTLHLNSIEFQDNDSIDRLICGCSVLESLSILGCKLENISVLRISAPALKIFIVDTQIKVVTSKCSYKVVLNTPKLQELKYIGFVAKGYSANSLNCLVKASINLGTSLGKWAYRTVGELLNKISKVQELRLSRGSSQAFKCCLSQLPEFQDLTYLRVGVDAHVWDILPNLLERSPNLKKLFLWGRLQGKHNMTRSSQRVSSCLLFHLEQFQIYGFEGDSTTQLDVVKYFLRNAKMLRKLFVQRHADLTQEKELEITKKLLMFQRASSNCKVVVC